MVRSECCRQISRPKGECQSLGNLKPGVSTGKSGRKDRDDLMEGDVNDDIRRQHRWPIETARV